MDITFIVVLLMAGTCLLLSLATVVNNQFYKWFSIIAVPLSFLVFAKVPMDIGTSLLYIPFLLSLAWSVVSLLLIAYTCARRRNRAYKDLAIGPSDLHFSYWYILSCRWRMPTP